jgi:flavodoxin
MVGCGFADENTQGMTSGSQTQESEKPTVTETEVPAENIAENSTSVGATDQAEEETEMKSLVVYFSWSGNTRSVAEEIQRQTGAEIFEIVPETPYTDNYNTLLGVAQQEQRNNIRPAISGSISNFSDYDVVFLGFPNWWADMPMVVYTFLDDYDLSGKTIAPFVTSGGSGFSGAINAIKSLEPDSDVVDGLHIRDGNAANPASAVEGWLSERGFN